MIEIKSISKSYSKNTILNSVSMNIETGDCIGIIGANGSGKTSLLSILSGIQKADNGSMIYDGKDILSNHKKILQYIGYVPQTNPLIPELSAYDNLRLWYNGSKDEFDKEFHDGIYNMLGIDEYKHKSVSKLSGGMKKRISIGIALCNNPKLLIMDEPSAALDISCKYDVRKYMKSFTKNGGAIIVASHDQNELSICNKLYLLKNGQLSAIDNSFDEQNIIELINERQ